jgi:diguanylate cyclase (GGDEF)-like protein/PAS domain S-box-containing protein
LYFPHLAPTGEVLGFMAVATELDPVGVDETERLERERLLRQLSNSAGSPILYIDREYIIRFANQPTLEWIEKSSDEVIGHHARDVYSEAAFTFYEPLVERALAGETIVREIPSLSRKHGARHVRVSVIPDLRANGQITGVFIAAIDIEDDMQLRAQLIERERQLALYTNNIPEAVAYLDLDRRYKFVNNAFLHMRGLPREAVIGKRSRELLGDAAAELATPFVERAFSGETVQYERLIAMPDGTERWHRVRTVPDMAANGAVQGIYVVGVDIHEVKTAQERLAREQAELRHANWLLSSHFENTPLAVIEWDPHLRVRRWSPQAEKIFGWTEADVIGKSVDEWHFVYDKDREQVADIAGRLNAHHTARATSLNRNFRKDGRIIWVEWYNSSLADDSGKVLSVFSLAQDVTTRVLAEERLVHQATHDGLTGLPNRVLLQERLQQAISRARRSGLRVATLFIDLDRFKDVNDTLGHRIGDELLREMSRRLQHAVRETDLLVRLSGDEFMVVLEQVSDLNAPPIVAGKLLDELRRAVTIEGHEIHVAGSIGISLFPDDAEDAETLLKNADMAMYRAKESGKNTYQSFTHDMAARGTAMRMLENALRSAIHKNQLVLRYQPKVDMKSGRIIGAEALVRWMHPTRGEVPPSDFIHLAEETGLVHDIGLWVLDAALVELRRWQDAGLSDLTLAVNIAAGQFRASHLAERIHERIRRVGVDARQLEVELTETGLIRDPDGVGRTLEALRRLGISVAIDDFGTGYSSLSHLKRFPIDTLKIDKSFVADLLNDADNRAIVSAVIALAHALDIAVVAEGVETQDQHDMLARLGCSAFQGFLFSRAIPANDFMALVRSQNP